MTGSRDALREGIARGRALWVPGAYDALSAKLIEAAGFPAILSTGYGIAAAHLGQPDAELYTMSENLAVTRAMASATTVPLIADCDTGYGNALNVMRTVREFEAAGAAGLLIEDQVAPKRCPAMSSQTELIPLEEAAGKIRAAVAARRDPNLVVLARTDAREPAEAIRRLKAYAAAGADVVHVISSCPKDLGELEAIRREVGRPLSIPVLGWLEDIAPERLDGLLAVAFMPFAPLFTAVEALRQNLAAMAATRSTRDLPFPAMAQAEFKRFIGFPELERLQAEFLPSTEPAGTSARAAA